MGYRKSHCSPPQTSCKHTRPPTPQAKKKKQPTNFLSRLDVPLFTLTRTQGQPRTDQRKGGALRCVCVCGGGGATLNVIFNTPGGDETQHWNSPHVTAARRYMRGKKRAASIRTSQSAAAQPQQRAKRRLTPPARVLRSHVSSAVTRR